jgi:hypothetical protein
MLRLFLIAALVALAAADKVYQCKSTYQESNVPACTGYDWPADYQMMCSKDDLEKGDESAYFTVADDVVPMCYTWVLRYNATQLVPNDMDYRKTMFLWRGANLQRRRKTCELTCEDVIAYTKALGDDYKTVYFSCSYMENGNNDSVYNQMTSFNLNPPTQFACLNNNDYEKPTGDTKPPQSQEIKTPDAVDPDWSSAVMIAQIVLIVVALVLVAAGAIVLFLFKSAMAAIE